MKMSFESRRDSLASRVNIISKQILRLEFGGNFKDGNIEKYLFHEGIVQIDRKILIIFIDIFVLSILVSTHEK